MTYRYFDSTVCSSNWSAQKDTHKHTLAEKVYSHCVNFRLKGNTKQELLFFVTVDEAAAVRSQLSDGGKLLPANRREPHPAEIGSTHRERDEAPLFCTSCLWRLQDLFYLWYFWFQSKRHKGECYRKLSSKQVNLCMCVYVCAHRRAFVEGFWLLTGKFSKPWPSFNKCNYTNGTDKDSRTNQQHSTSSSRTLMTLQTISLEVIGHCRSESNTWNFTKFIAPQ